MGLFNKKNSQEAKTPEIKKQPAGSAAVNPDDIWNTPVRTKKNSDGTVSIKESKHDAVHTEKVNDNIEPEVIKTKMEQLEKELEEKSARLSQLNLELDNEEKSQGKSAEATEDAPARDSADEEDTPPEKPSIRAQLRAFTPPARVTAGTERAYSRGTEL